MILAFRIVSFHFAGDCLHGLLLPPDDVVNLVSLFNIDGIEAFIYGGELLHDLDILAARFFVKARITRRLLLQARVEEEQFLVELLFEVEEPSVDGLFDHGEVSLPGRVRVIITLQFLLNDKEVGFEIVLIDFVINEGRVIAHDLSLCQQLVRFLRLHDLAIGVSHECNEHVEESNLSEESCQKEECVAEVDLRFVVKGVNREFSQRQHILVVEGIQDPITAKHFFNHSVFIAAIELQDVHWDAEHEEGHHEDEEEVANIIDSFCNQLDEE